MQLALMLFPDSDGLDGFLEASMPWFAAWLFLLALALVIILIGNAVVRLRPRSPVEQLLRRRFS